MSAPSRAPRVATATLNAALDVTLGIEGFCAGEKRGVRGEHLQAGGKGVNVARSLGQLGVPAVALVVVGGSAGRRIRESLASDALPALVLEAEGESRTCLELVEPDGRATQLHGRGIEGSAALAARVVTATRALPARVGWLALCGSLPEGMPAHAARDLLEAARQRGLRTAVDIRGPALCEAAAAAPDLMRVNEDEFRELTAMPLARWMRSATAPGLAIVSRGAAPFEAATAAGDRFRVHPPRVEAVNPIGCGDAMMAGLLAALLEDATPAETLRRATALAAAESLSPIAGSPDPATAHALLGQVEIERLQDS